MIPQVKLYRPKGAHKAYRLYLRHPNGDMEKLASEELFLVNQRLKQGLIGIAEADRLADAVHEGKVKERDRELGIAPLLFTDDNMKLFAKYEKDYEERNIKEKSRLDRLTKTRRALGSLQGLSVAVATRAEMSAALATSVRSPGAYNELVSCLNSVLKYIGRSGVSLFKKDDTGRFIRFIGGKEFATLLPFFSHQEQLLMVAAFASGMRYGEVLGAETRRLKPNPKLQRTFYYVERQWHVKEEKYAPPKRGKKRDTVLSEGYVDGVREALSLTLTERLEAGDGLGSRVRAKAKELWPKDEDKHVDFHDLRHCYATNALAHGISLSHVARFLGNGLKVTEDYYASYTFSDEIYSLPTF